MKLNNPRLLNNQLFINGQWLDSQQTFDVHNPATGEVIASVADAQVAHAHQAIEAANTAFQSFRHMPASERAAILKRFAALIREHIDDLAMILTSEMGKPLHEAHSELQFCINKFDWFSAEAVRVFGATAPITDPSMRRFIIKQPVGVCAAITPWNWPAGMPANKLSTSLAAGCTLILKPAEDTPLTALALAQLSIQAGVPAGVFNVLPCASPVAVGDALMESPIVRKFTFTGSTAVGKQLNEKAASTVKKVTLELGGNAPFIIFDDANLEKAVTDLFAMKFLNAGQVCISPNRIYVHDAIYDKAISQFQPLLKKIKLGNGLDDGTTQGPQINQKGVDKIQHMVDDAKAKGARILCGGKPADLGQTFYEPTMIADANEEMDVAHDEIFGPAVIFYRFHDEAQVIKKSNDTHYGLAAYVYTQNIGRATRVSEALEYGVVAVNTTDTGSDQTPFGGMKQSGLGREGGQFGIDGYLEEKTISLCIE